MPESMPETVRVEIARGSVSDTYNGHENLSRCITCTATLTGRDALVMDWARKTLAYDAAWDRWYHGGEEKPVPPEAYNKELAAMDAALSALSAFDAAQEGNDGK